MLSFLIIAAIAIAVVIGYKTGFNTGFFAIIFAYLIGAFALGMSPSEIIKGWPINTMFVIFSVSLFYNFALVNGTLEKTARYLLYAFQKFPALLPFALYVASAGIAALGAGFFTVMAFMAPITMLICEEAKMDKLLGAVAINCGALSGANFMTSGSGIIFRGLMDNNGYTDTSFNYSAVIFIASVIFSLLLITLFRFITVGKSFAATSTSFEKPEPFTALQKKNVYLMVLMIATVLIFPLLHIVLPNVEIISFINSKIDVGLVAIIFSAIALFMKLGPQNEVVAKVPWNTIIMICGVGMLINVAIAAGINPLILFTCIVIGAQSSAISPFSSGGSLVLGSCATEEERSKMFPKLLFRAVPISVLSATVFNVILSFIL
ncbi:MAG: SLC13 family permease [Candidatus Ruminococcus intestinipullorum]|nr:SLC13 family permease [Candidatus Ruminococcus intestinipullorum]